MKLTRKKRIALELLGPSFLGTILLYVLTWGAAVWYGAHNRTAPLGWEPMEIQAVGIVLIFAYLFAGLPSIIYTCIMEWRFNRGLNPASWNTVGWSTFLGLISGGTIIAAIGGTGWKDALAFYAGVGISVGFLLGLIIKIWSTEKRTTGENPP